MSRVGLSLRYIPHKPARLIIADRQICHLKSAPAGLPLCQWEVASRTNDLSDPSMAEQMGVRGCGLVDTSMM
jgi:hypothetical protein